MPCLLGGAAGEPRRGVAGGGDLPDVVAVVEQHGGRISRPAADAVRRLLFHGRIRLAIDERRGDGPGEVPVRASGDVVQPVVILEEIQQEPAVGACLDISILEPILHRGPRARGRRRRSPGCAVRRPILRAMANARAIDAPARSVGPRAAARPRARGARAAPASHARHARPPAGCAGDRWRCASSAAASRPRPSSARRRPRRCRPPRRPSASSGLSYQSATPTKTVRPSFDHSPRLNETIRLSRGEASRGNRVERARLADALLEIGPGQQHLGRPFARRIAARAHHQQVVGIFPPRQAGVHGVGGIQHARSNRSTGRRAARRSRGARRRRR